MLEKTRILALIHDDAEMITGDIPVHQKMKMSKVKLTEMESSKEKALHTFAEKYQKKYTDMSIKICLCMF